MAAAPLIWLPILLALASITSTSATLMAEEYYWSTVLPGTPMPSALRDHLRPRRSRLDTPSSTKAAANDHVLIDPVAAVNRPTVGVEGGKTAAKIDYPRIAAVEGQISIDPVEEVNRPAIVLSRPKMVTVGVEGGKTASKIVYVTRETEGREKISAATGLRTSGGGAVKPITAAAVEGQISIDPVAEVNRPALLLSRPKQGITDPHTFTAADDGDLIDQPTVHSFFLEKDLRRGAKMKFWANRAFSGDFFLPREVADSIPFSTGRLPELLSRFALRPDSALAVRMAETLRMCEGQKLCATSLESMVDIAAAALGTRDLETASTVVDGRVPGQVYTVDSWSAVPIAGETSLGCHALVYPYTVFRCHRTPATRLYSMRLVGLDGTEVAAAAMCHVDTSAWEPTLEPLVAFNEKPGGAAVCHLLQEGDVLWFARSIAGAGAVASA